MDFWLVLAFFAGIAATLLFFWASDRRARRLRAAEYQKRGVEVKEEQSGRLLLFLGEIKAAYDEETATGAQIDLKSFGTKKVLPIALKYPDVIAKHGKQLLKLLQGGKGGGLDIGSLLGGGLLGAAS